MKIVITGSTGQIGRHLTKLIDFEKNEVVLIGRDRSKLQDAAARGARVLQGDILDVEFLREALAGADTYFFLPPPNFQSSDMIEEYRRLATVSRDAAKTVGVKRIIHLSTLGAHLNREETGLVRGQHFAETIISDGAPHVLHLRCGFFLENYFMALPNIIEQGAIFFPVAPDARYAFVSTINIAEAVRDLLETSSWVGHSVIELQGPKEYSFADVAGEFTAGLGREVKHVTVPPEAAEQAMKELGLSEAYARELVHIFTSIEAGILTPEFSRNDAHVRQSGLTPKEFAEQVLDHALQPV